MPITFKYTENLAARFKTMYGAVEISQPRRIPSLLLDSFGSITAPSAALVRDYQLELFGRGRTTHQTDLDDAVDQLGDVLDVRSSEAAISHLKQYIGRMTIGSGRDRSFSSPQDSFYLFSDSSKLNASSTANNRRLRAAYQTAESSQPVSYMDQQLDARDFISLAHFIMTAVPLKQGQVDHQIGLDDTRLDLVERLS